MKDFFFYGSYTHLWYLHAAIVSFALISGLLYLHFSPKKIVIIAFSFYFVGLFAQSWFGFIKPLEGTLLWDCLKLMKKIIVSTRNGLFMGFIFAGIGMLFAFYRIPITKKQAQTGFLFSLLLMVSEALILKRFGFIRESDTYFFLVPASFFLFACLRCAKLPDSGIYRELQMLSTNIYYVHLWVYYVVTESLEMLDKPLATWMVFLITLAVTLILSIVILKLSDRSGFKWLKKLYS